MREPLLEAELRCALVAQLHEDAAAGRLSANRNLIQFVAGGEIYHGAAAPFRGRITSPGRTFDKVPVFSLLKYATMLWQRRERGEPS